MIHFYMILSGNPKLEFQAEVFIRSLELFGKVDYCLTICQGQNDKLFSPILRNKAEVIKHSGPSWQSGFSCVPIKGEITVYTDADIMICDDLTPMMEQCQNKVGGVLAYVDPLINWKKLFGEVPWERMYDFPSGGKCPYYINLGFVAVPTKFIPALNEAFPKWMKHSQEVYPGHYHKPQFAMCLSVESLKLPRIPLPIRWNAPDLFPDLFVDNPAVVHLLDTKSKVYNWKDVHCWKPTTKVRKWMQRRLSLIMKKVI